MSAKVRRVYVVQYYLIIIDSIDDFEYVIPDSFIPNLLDVGTTRNMKFKMGILIGSGLNEC